MSRLNVVRRSFLRSLAALAVAPLAAVAPRFNRVKVRGKAEVKPLTVVVTSGVGRGTDSGNIVMTYSIIYSDGNIASEGVIHPHRRSDDIKVML